MKNVELKYTIYRKINGGANAPLAPPLATALLLKGLAIQYQLVKSKPKTKLKLLTRSVSKQRTPEDL